MKTVKIVKKVLFTIIAVVYFSFALCMTLLLLNYNDYNVTQFGDTSLIILNDDVKVDGYKKGDLVLVESKELDEISEGEVVFAYRIDSNGYPQIQVGKVGEIYPEEEALSFENGDTYSMKFVAGKPTNVYEGIGSFLSVVESQWGFLFIVLVPCFLIFIYELYALIIEIKYGNEEEE